MPAEKLQNEECEEVGQKKDKDSDNMNKQNENNEQLDKAKSPPKKNRLIGLGTAKKKTTANDPFRFAAPGLDFKAKLIGIREVAESRGDQMCQDAMMLLKAAVKASGQHKQRVLFNISLEGFKLKDEKSMNELHNFPVSKVSFIARDTSDQRAFGFIYGTPDSKHQFYAIKTAQAADQAVLSIRDMFHVVYEMKKKVIENEKAKKDENKEDTDLNHNQTPTDNSEQLIPVADLLELEDELTNLDVVRQNTDQLDITIESQQSNGQSQSTGSFSGNDTQSAFTTSGTYSTGVAEDNPFGDSFVPQPNQSQSQSVNGAVDLFGAPQHTPLNSQPPVSFNLTSANGVGLTPGSADPFDTSGLSGVLDLHKQSTPLFPPNNMSFNQLQPATPFMANASQALSSVHSSGGLAASPFDASADWASHTANHSQGQVVLQANNSQLNHAFINTNSALDDNSWQPSPQGEASVPVPVSSIDDAFSKLVNMDAIMGQPPKTSASTFDSAPVTTLDSTNGNGKADPFAHMRPPKPTINTLRNSPTGMLAQTQPVQVAQPLDGDKLKSLFASSPVLQQHSHSGMPPSMSTGNPFGHMPMSPQNGALPNIPPRNANPFLPAPVQQPMGPQPVFASASAGGNDPFANDPFFK